MGSLATSAMLEVVHRTRPFGEDFRLGEKTIGPNVLLGIVLWLATVTAAGVKMASDDEEEVDVFTDAEQTVAEPGRRAPSSPPPPSLPPRTLPATATSSTLGASSDASARAPEASTSTAAPTAGPTRGRTLRLAIYGVFVVSFSHQVGPIVDWRVLHHALRGDETDVG